MAAGCCAECQHWGVTELGSRPFREGTKRCHQLEEAVDQDGEPFSSAALATAADFGCVLFTPAAAEAG